MFKERSGGVISIRDTARSVGHASISRLPNPGRSRVGNTLLRAGPNKASGCAGAVGFSLVEMAVCCALIGLLALICIRGLQGTLPAARVSRALGEVVALLEWSRWSSVRLGCVFRVDIDPEQAVLTVFRTIRDDTGEEQLVMARRLDLHEEHPGVVFGAADGVVRTSGCKLVDPSGVHLLDHSLRFLPSGTADRCGSLYLIPEPDLPDRGDRMRAVSILLATGRLQTWSYNPSEKSDCEHDGAWQAL